MYKVKPIFTPQSLKKPVLRVLGDNEGATGGIRGASPAVWIHEKGERAA